MNYSAKYLDLHFGFTGKATTKKNCNVHKVSDQKSTYFASWCAMFEFCKFFLYTPFVCSFLSELF